MQVCSHLAFLIRFVQQPDEIRTFRRAVAAAVDSVWVVHAELDARPTAGSLQNAVAELGEGIVHVPFRVLSETGVERVEQLLGVVLFEDRSNLVLSGTLRGVELEAFVEKTADIADVYFSQIFEHVRFQIANGQRFRIRGEVLALESRREVV